MAQDRETVPTSSSSDASDASRPSGLRNPGRRLVLGGIPIAVTLASKPALAMTGQCSVSNALSGNLSHPLPNGVNCGMSPQTWIDLAGTNQLWPRTAMYPQTNFTTASGSPGFGNAWQCGSESMLSALQGGLTIQCKINGQMTTLNAQLFGEQVAAAALNAAAFSPNNYSQSLGDIQASVQAIWSSHPNSKTQAQTLLDTLTNQLAPLNINT